MLGKEDHQIHQAKVSFQSIQQLHHNYLEKVNMFLKRRGYFDSLFDACPVEECSEANNKKISSKIQQPDVKEFLRLNYVIAL